MGGGLAPAGGAAAAPRQGPPAAAAVVAGAGAVGRSRHGPGLPPPRPAHGAADARAGAGEILMRKWLHLTENHVHSLGLAQNFAVTDEGLASLSAGLRHLRSLSLGYTNVTAEGLLRIVGESTLPPDTAAAAAAVADDDEDGEGAEEPRRRRRRPRRPRLQQRPVVVRTGLVSLQHLSVYNCQLTAAAAAQLRALLPGVRICM
jgi:hypothetical protein